MQPFRGRWRRRLRDRTTRNARNRPLGGSGRRPRLEWLERRELLAVVEGLVWLDANQDGLRQESEPGVPGAVVELQDVGGSARGISLTGADGRYAFDGVESGEYRLAARLPVGFAFTAQDAGADDLVDSDFDPASGQSPVFTVAADDLQWDAGLTGETPPFGFALAAGGPASDRARAVALDTSGNVYVTGSFSGLVDFDASPALYLLSGQGDEDVFVAKYNAGGALVWARGLGGEQARAEGLDIALSAAGEIHVTGRFSGTVDFDPAPGAQELLTREGTGSDIFVARLRPADGSLVWARQAAAEASDDQAGGAGHALALDADANIYLTGAFRGRVDFDPATGAHWLDAGDAERAFFWKLTPEGDLAWAISSSGGSSSTVGAAVAVDAAGRLYAGGHFEGTTALGSASLSSQGERDVFVTRLGADGVLAWAAGFGGPGDETLGGLAADPWGNVLLAGGFEQTVDFDPGAEEYLLTALGARDAFVGKLDPQSRLQWVRSFGGTDSELASGVAVDRNGNVYSTGSFRGVVDFDPGFSTDVRTSSGSGDVFLSKLDGLGNHVGVLSFGGPLGQQFASLAVDPLGRTRISGAFRADADHPADFDPGADSYPLLSQGALDLFLASLEIRKPSNSAPVLEPAGIGVRTDEQTPITLELSDWINNGAGTTTVVDADTSDSLGGVALIRTSGRGTFYYSLDGTAFEPVGVVSGQAALLLPPSALLRYVPDELNGELAEITFRAWDGSTGVSGEKISVAEPGGDAAFSVLTETITVEVADVNDAPVLEVAAPRAATNEDTPLELTVADLSNGQVGVTRITDVDRHDPRGGVALTQFMGFGQLSYSLDGQQFIRVDSPGDANALLLPADARLRYVPDGVHGHTMLLAYRAWDESGGTAGGRANTLTAGGSTPFSALSDTLTVSVADVNDAPELRAGQPSRATSEDEPLLIPLADFINAPLDETRIGDVDPGAQIGGIAAVGSSGRGTWEYSVDGIQFRDVSSLSESAALLLPAETTLRYTPDSANGETAFLQFRAWDATQGTAGDRFHVGVPGGTTAFSSNLDTLWINVGSRNDAPVDILLGASSVSENKVGAVIGTVTAVDPDEGDHHAWSVSDDRFEVVDGLLRLKAGQVLDHESRDQVPITLTAIDSGQLAYSEAFLIDVLDVNEPPTEVRLSDDRVPENAAGAVVGQLSVLDPDEGDTHTFGVSDGRFEVVDAQLKLKEGIRLDHEAAETVQLQVTAFDAGDLPRTETFSILVLDVNEAPEQNGELPDQSGMANIPLSFTVAEAAFFDVDEGDRLTFSASLADGGALPEWLAFDPSTRTFSGLPSIHDPGPYQIRVTATDQGNLSADDTFMLVIHQAAAPWQNPANPMDVNNDGNISPVDILILINYINTHPGNPALPTAPLAPPPFYDVNGDNLITPADILVIVNFANGGGTAEGEHAGLPDTLHHAATPVHAATPIQGVRRELPPGGSPLPEESVVTAPRSSPAVERASSGATLAPEVFRGSRSLRAEPGDGESWRVRRETWERLSASEGSAWWLDEHPAPRRS